MGSTILEFSENETRWLDNLRNKLSDSPDFYRSLQTHLLETAILCLKVTQSKEVTPQEITSLLSRSNGNYRMEIINRLESNNEIDLKKALQDYHDEINLVQNQQKFVTLYNFIETI